MYLDYSLNDYLEFHLDYRLNDYLDYRSNIYLSYGTDLQYCHVQHQLKFHSNSISTSMQLSSFHEHVNAIEQLYRHVNAIEQLL
jgi:hypothetical protein